MGTVDCILYDISPENLVSLVIPVKCCCPSEIGQMEGNIYQLRHVKRNAEDISTTSKQQEGV